MIKKCNSAILKFSKISMRNNRTTKMAANHHSFDLKPDESLLFVYGTLKTNQPNHRELFDLNNGQARFIASAITLEKYPLVIASKFNIPYLLRQPGTGNCVHGEIYAVDKQMLTSMDEFEGHPKYYTRLEEPVETNHHGVIKAWAYFLKHYKDTMLDLPMYSNYDSYGEHGLRYVERCDRQPNNAKSGHTEKKDVKI